MNIWGRLLRWARWEVSITAPARRKCVICVAPHTSNWDFILGLLAYYSVGRKACFLMKKFWFFFPLKYLLKSLGGIPVVPKTKGGGNLTTQLVKRFDRSWDLNLAVTPEGTRSAVTDWHTGFLHIAYEAGVPIQLGVIDYSRKKIIIRDEFNPTGDFKEDMKYVKNYYRQFPHAALDPDKFAM